MMMRDQVAGLAGVVWTGDINLGDALSAGLSTLALLLATYQLVRSRRDLVAERRADFLLTHLAELSAALNAHQGEEPSGPVVTRMMILPPDLIRDRLPVLHAWLNNWSAAEALAELDLPDDGSAAETLVTLAGEEVQAAVAGLLTVRPVWWKRGWSWCRRRSSAIAGWVRGRFGGDPSTPG